MLRDIYLYGSLEEKFGRGPFQYAAADLQDVVSGMNTIASGFKAELIKNGEYTVIKGTESGREVVPVEEVGMLLGDSVKEIHIVPNVEGSGFEIAAALMLTAAEASAAAAAGGLLAAGFYGTIAVGVLINVGIALAVGALAQMLAPTPKSGTSGTGRQEDHQSFLFSGAMNVVEQGGPVPLVYGQFRTGSTVISVGVTVEDISAS